MAHDVDSISKTELTRRTALKGIGAASLAALAAKGGLSVASAQDAAGEIPTLAFTAKDMEFVGLPDSVAGGFTRLSMTQEGPSDHHAIFMRLNEGVTADDFMAAIESGDFGAILGSGVSLGGPNAGAVGSTVNVVVDLAPGQYVVVCLIPDEEMGMLHAAMGMFHPLEVTAGDGAAAAPEAQATIDLVDFGFQGLEGDVPAGPHVWAVVDTGEQPHELVIYKQAPGVPYEVIEGIFLSAPEVGPEASPVGVDDDASPIAEASPEAAGPPPFTAIGGTAPMFPGVTNYLEVTLDAGDYFAICFIPDAASGAPHFALGMIMPFTVV